MNNPYTLNQMINLLQNRKKLRESAHYGGGERQIDMLVDLEILLRQCNLTDKQQDVLRLYYDEQLTQEEVAKVLNISQQAVLDHLNKIKQKINTVIERWKRIEQQH